MDISPYDGQMDALQLDYWLWQLELQISFMKDNNSQMQIELCFQSYECANKFCYAGRIYVHSKQSFGATQAQIWNQFKVSSCSHIQCDQRSSKSIITFRSYWCTILRCTRNYSKCIPNNAIEHLNELQHFIILFLHFAPSSSTFGFPYLLLTNATNIFFSEE